MQDWPRWYEPTLEDMLRANAYRFFRRIRVDPKSFLAQFHDHELKGHNFGPPTER